MLEHRAASHEIRIAVSADKQDIPLDKPEPFEWSALTARAASLEDEFGLEFGKFVESLRKMNRSDATHLYV